MKKMILMVIAIVFMFSLLPYCTYAQMDQLHGDQNWSASGLHSGNQIRTTFWNDGQVGCRRSSPDDWQGEWPINSGRTYLAKISTLYASEVRGTDGVLRHIMSESNGTRTAEVNETAGDFDQDTGLWWTMAPLPGFHNPDPPPDRTDRIRVAMSQWEWAWPAYWPDKNEDPVDPGWPGKWNGYFGKGFLNADQESYYVIDDYNNREFPFYPDQTDSSRRGLGLRVTVPVITLARR